MRRRTRAWLLIVFALAGLAAAAVVRLLPSAAPQPVDLSGPVEDFVLPDCNGHSRSLAELGDRELVVIVSLGTKCPLAKAYGPTLAGLADEFGPRGVGFLAVDSNAHDSAADVAALAAEQQLPFPVLIDSAQAVADRLGADRTPEAIVLDRRRVVRYRGRIDDQFGIGVHRPAPQRRDLAEALEELLAGRPVSRPEVPASGCQIGRSPSPAATGPVTYAKEVSRILQRRCVECHRAGEAAPFPLTEYRDAVGWAATIREVVESGRMPPWSASPEHGRFRNDPRLTAEEKDLLRRWIDYGCPEGDPADLPPPPAFADGWRIPQPDRVVFIADEPFAVPARGDVAYQYFLVDPGFREDVFVRAAEVRPDKRSVVHHALVLLVPPGASRSAADSLGAMLNYAPGMPPLTLPEGVALRIPAGSKFLFQMHYTPDGAERIDRSSLGLVFADPKTVKQCVRGGAVVNTAIEIPPGARDYRLTAEWRADEDLLLLSLSPHLHLRGKSFRFEAVFPDGRREVLLDVPRYDFHWQLRYELAEPRLLPRGGKLVCTATWDNSADNPNNPDPTRTVVWGDQTSDEMLIGFFTAIPAGR